MSTSLLSKSELTRAQIVDAAVEMARHAGLESLTIGAVAERAGLSKSGVFSRVGSREELQLAALKAYERRFIEQVIAPSLREPRGLPRMRALLRRWLQRMADTDTQGGCLFASGAFEYDDRPGPLRDAVVEGLQQMRRHLARTLQQAIDEGQLRPDTDTEALAFAISSLMLGVHHDTRLFGEQRAPQWAEAALERLLAAYAT
jgi:AcrR family transcriptional regulator